VERGCDEFNGQDRFTASMMTFHTELSASREHNTTHMLLLQLCAVPVTLGVFCFSKLD